MNREDYIKIIQNMADEDGISVEEEEKKLQEMIDELFTNMDEEILESWKNLLCISRNPTVEEFLYGMAAMLESVYSKKDTVLH